jgi:uncharacterized protein (DUF1810 family)
MNLSSDPYDLQRFITAQEGVYERALAEISSGQKRSHWMWFIFPQIDGLGFSSISKYYAIKSIEEAREYLNHPLLGKRLLECAQAALAIQERSASEIFGYPDDLKLKSAMTLFTRLTEPGSVFDHVLGKYFQGEQDSRTLVLFAELEEKGK